MPTGRPARVGAGGCCRDTVDFGALWAPGGRACSPRIRVRCAGWRWGESLVGGLWIMALSGSVAGPVCALGVRFSGVRV